MPRRTCCRLSMPGRWRGTPATPHPRPPARRPERFWGAETRPAKGLSRVLRTHSRSAPVTGRASDQAQDSPSSLAFRRSADKLLRRRTPSSMDRASVYGTEGCRFDPCGVRFQRKPESPSQDWCHSGFFRVAGTLSANLTVSANRAGRWTASGWNPRSDRRAESPPVSGLFQSTRPEPGHTRHVTRATCLRALRLAPHSHATR